MTQNEVFQRMQRQPKFKYYQRNDFFEDGRAMRLPPANTVSRENWESEQIGTGLNPDGTFVETIPFKVDMATLELGRKNFQIVCAACHGLAGDGQSMVAANMALAPPPSFHSEKLKGKPDGYIFQVATHGYGMMPPFGWRLTPKERWAVVAYIRALEYSQSAPIAEAPADIQAKLMQEAQ
ncbi:MAG: cytochrome c [Myxococcaceae bacterium]|nr:cytochrome c [Myxococcaceae bacterium]